MINYSDILLKGFVFDQIEISEELERDIWAQNFTTSNSSSSVSFFLKKVDRNITNKIVELICKKTTDTYLVNLFKEFNF